MKKKWRNAEWRKQSLEARRGRPLKEFLQCGHVYWSDLYQKKIRCTQDRHRDLKHCPDCEERIQFRKDNPLAVHRMKMQKKRLYPWKWNGKRIDLPDGTHIDVPKDHLFLDLTL